MLMCYIALVWVDSAQTCLFYNKLLWAVQDVLALENQEQM